MNDPTVAFIEETGTHRLLSSAYIDEPAIAPLYDDEFEKAVLDGLEAKSSNRLLGQNGEIDELDPNEMLSSSFGYGWSFVNAAFSYTRVGGNRFNREGRGAWYAALSVDTCLQEVCYHLSRELNNTAETENTTKYVQLLAHIAGPMACLLDCKTASCLDPEPAVGYPEGQRFAAEIRKKDLTGIRYPSIPTRKALILPCLRPVA